MIPKKLLDPSPEQLDFLLGSSARQNWAHGPVRAGKNHVLNIRFSELLATWPTGNEDSDVYLGGKSKDAVERIFLRDLLKWLGDGNWTYNKARGRGTFNLIRPANGLKKKPVSHVNFIVLGTPTRTATRLSLAPQLDSLI